MISLIQRVSQANVTIDNIEVSAIRKGILALIGIEKSDNLEVGKKLLNRILSYRIFDDAEGKMNLCLKDIQGGLLIVPQFTLVAETRNGTRPGFSKGMPPIQGEVLFYELIEFAKQLHVEVASGVFGANMQVNLCNDGPVTFSLTCPSSD